MLEEIKKCFIHGYLDETEDPKIFRANGKRIPILKRKGDKTAGQTVELAVSDCMSTEATCELPNSPVEAQAQSVDSTRPIQPQECNQDPVTCGQSQYSESISGFYNYYCERTGHPLLCDAPGATKYRKHYTQVEKETEIVYDDSMLIEPEHEANND